MRQLNSILPCFPRTVRSLNWKKKSFVQFPDRNMTFILSIDWHLCSEFFTAALHGQEKEEVKHYPAEANLNNLDPRDNC